ncbi:zinc finger protein 729-like isoform X2 [Ochlerotatus camptorhynchus]|uniref:zinc finger protein 729-like isoform X2 n=1 Tax=Ochlerotatus camptorhynchus TaxID=644619 RepID=UPI0031D97B0C
MIECEICLEEYQEGDLELHREMCVLRLMFRCSLCHGDYVSKEGLWNHLDLHEIADESKELHYQEIKAKHKLHQCVLCNDQRAYSESLYWKHVHDVHDGFFVRCSDCGENFRSEKLKSDHVFSHCKARDQTVASDFIAPEEKPVPMIVGNTTSDADHLKLSLGEQSSNANEDLKNVGPCTKCSHCGIEESSAFTLARHILIHHEAVACDLCGITLPSLSQALQHKSTKHKTVTFKCSHCLMQFTGRMHFKNHVSKCEKKTVPCEICGKMYENVISSQHRRNGCRVYKMSKEQKQNNSETSPLGKSQTKCYYCNEEFPSPGQFYRHLQICHELTKCEICGITILGISANRYHKIQSHTEPKYECPTCGTKFHRKTKYDAHWLLCEQGMHSCKLCDRMFKRMGTLNRHTMLYHPDESSLENLQMEIIAGETTISARDDQGQSTVNPSSKDDDSNSQLNELSLDNLNDDDSMDSQGIDKESERCKICGDIFPSYKQVNYHMLIKHMEGKLQCPHCPKKFHFKERLQKHSSCCARLKYSCKLCGEKFKYLKSLKKHKKRVHRGNKHKSKAKIEDADCTAERKQKRDAAHGMTICIVCNMTFASIDELIIHKLTCPKPAKEHDDSQCGAEEEKVQTESTNVPQGKNIELTLKDSSDPQEAAENPSSKASRTKCSHCGLQESSAAALGRHILVHHDPVACDLCGLTLPSLVQAQHHKKTKHMYSKLKCIHCSMRFPGRLTLIKHVSKCEKKIIPCEFCGRMFENEAAVKNHWRVVCRAYIKSKEEKLKNTESSLCDESDSPSGMEKIAPPLVESGLSQTKCYYCTNKELFSPGLLNHHLQISHELTKCDICGITILGISPSNNHKKKCHLEPKYECPTCGEKFHRKTKYNDHCFLCEHKMYSCTLCGRTFKQAHSIKFHNKRYHPGESSLANLQIVQDEELVQKNNRYSCKLCGRTFKQPHSVKRHSKQCHPDESSNDLQMVGDDQGQSTVNLSSKVDVSDSRSNEHSSANLNDDDLMDSQTIEKEPRVVPEKPSQPLVDNASKHLFSCNICGINFSSYYQINYHMVTNHTEAKFECPHCSRKFHFKTRSEQHAASCASLKHSCELCGQKFNLLSRVEKHKKRVHRGDKHLGNVNIEGAVCTEQNGVENINLDLDIKVEETMLQEQEYQVTNEQPGRSSATALHPHGDKSKDVEAEDAEDPDNEIKVKEEYLEDEDEILAEHQTSDRNESLVGAGDQLWSCSVCGLTFGTKPKMKYHMVASHLEPRYKCSACEKMFHFTCFLRRHEKSCLEMRCRKCGIKFATRRQLHNHNIDKHPHDGKSKDVEASSEDLENGIKVQEEYPEVEEEILTEHQSTTESAEGHEALSDENEPLANVRSMIAKRKPPLKRKKLSSGRSETRKSKTIRLKDEK